MAAFNIPKDASKTHTHFSPSMWIEHHPFYAAFVLVAVVLGILYVLRHGVTQASGTSSTSSTTSGMQPFLVQGPEGPAGPPGPPGKRGKPGTTPPPPPPPPNTQLYGTIRAQYSISQYHQYDSTHSGVPIRSTINQQFGGPMVGTASWNSKIKITGSAQTGQPNAPGGSTLWYPVTGGFVSAQDIVSFSNS